MRVNEDHAFYGSLYRFYSRVFAYLFSKSIVNLGAHEVRSFTIACLHYTTVSRIVRDEQQDMMNDLTPPARPKT